MDQREQYEAVQPSQAPGFSARAWAALKAAAKFIAAVLRATWYCMVIEKLRSFDLNVAWYRLANKCYRESSADAPQSALCGRVSQLDEQIAQKKGRPWFAPGASFREKVRVFAKRLSDWFVSQTLRINRAACLISLGAALEKSNSILPPEELARVRAIREKVASVETARHALLHTSEFRKGVLWLVAGTLGVVAIGILASLAKSGKDADGHSVSHPARANAPSDLASPSNQAADSNLEKDVQSWLDEGVACLRQGDMERAFSNFMKAAQRGHAEGQLQVGWHLENGAGVSRDKIAAAKWYQKSAEQGSARAMKNLGQLYENGEGVPENWEAAAAWYRKGAEKNEPDAEAALGRAYQFGIGVPQNRAVSIYWNERALAHGDLSSERWVRWLRDSTNNVGFRNPEEQNFVLGNRLRSSGLLLGADPAGILFRDSGERTAWLRGLRKAVDRDEDESRRRLAEFERQQTEDSKRRHGSEVQRLQAQGYSREAAESRAGW